MARRFCRSRGTVVAVALATAWALAACTTGPAKAPKAPMADAAPVQVYAAGSLREAFTAIARDHEARTG